MFADSFGMMWEDYKRVLDFSYIFGDLGGQHLITGQYPLHSNTGSLGMTRGQNMITNILCSHNRWTGA